MRFFLESLYFFLMEDDEQEELRELNIGEAYTNDQIEKSIQNTLNYICNDDDCPHTGKNPDPEVIWKEDLPASSTLPEIVRATSTTVSLADSRDNYEKRRG